MNIDIYAICWNEADMLGFFFKHYDSIASRYIIYDDGSTDGSLDILHRHPKVEVRPFDRSISDSYVLSAQRLHNSAWKESRKLADWVFLTAIDEHLVHDDLLTYLRRCKAEGSTIIPALGFQMISDDFPKPNERLCHAVTTGAPFAKMSKLCVFRPDQIDETNFCVGRHSADPTGNVVLPPTDEMLNLHFKYLDFNRLARRHKVLAGGLGTLDNTRGFGHRYHFGEEQLRKDWRAFQSQAVGITKPGFQAASHHENQTWWRNRTPPYPVSDTGSKAGLVRKLTHLLGFGR